MHIEVIKRENQVTSRWAGGTTTQLAIFPQSAEYAKRNFLWRLSSAVVELEESTFTSLPGISRKIMILEGELRLEHEQHHSAILKPFEQDAFEGDWTTRSFGKVRDFNLMTTAGCTGVLGPLNIEASGQAAELLEPSNHPETHALYCVDGEIKIRTLSGSEFSLGTGDLLMMHTERQEKKFSYIIQNQFSRPAHLVQVIIHY